MLKSMDYQNGRRLENQSNMVQHVFKKVCHISKRALPQPIESQRFSCGSAEDRNRTMARAVCRNSKYKWKNPQSEPVFLLLLISNDQTLTKYSIAIKPITISKHMFCAWALCSN